MLGGQEASLKAWAGWQSFSICYSVTVHRGGDTWWPGSQPEGQGWVAEFLLRRAAPPSPAGQREKAGGALVSCELWQAGRRAVNPWTGGLGGSEGGEVWGGWWVKGVRQETRKRIIVQHLY